jgi:hypothetical protein
VRTPTKAYSRTGIDRAISEFDLDAEKVPAAPDLMDQELRRLSERVST